jgi:hypothetical protein
MAVTASHVQARCGGLRRGGQGAVGYGRVWCGWVWRSSSGEVGQGPGGHGVAVTACYGAVGFGLLRQGGLGPARTG